MFNIYDYQIRGTDGIWTMIELSYTVVEFFLINEYSLTVSANQP